MILYDKGLYCKGADLWMDSKRVKPFCYVSHAHSDHAARHKRIISTPETAAFLSQRFNVLDIETVPFNQWIQHNGARFKLFPAGHILGSSQILIETGDCRIVYTGDFRLGKSRSCEDAEVNKCDVLIMETTYGTPEYTFPDRLEVEEEFVAFINQALNRGQVPVVMAYSLGKAQEAIAILSNAGIRIQVEKSIYKLARIYERFGVQLGRYSKFTGADFGAALIIPPHMKNFKNIQAIPDKTLIFLTGWGAGDKIQSRFSADKVFILSDHCDYLSLMRYVEETSPRRIYTLHGFEAFAAYLRAQGYNAVAMKPGVEYQLSRPIFYNNLDLFK
ncbi:MAG: hypothetical protein GF315_11000 [candidate division Zixibacteria bacterium]|nr:hypothetical protein [candidate division Zixibacteria bacterium]